MQTVNRYSVIRDRSTSTGTANSSNLAMALRAGLCRQSQAPGSITSRTKRSNVNSGAAKSRERRRSSSVSKRATAPVSDDKGGVVRVLDTLKASTKVPKLSIVLPVVGGDRTEWTVDILERLAHITDVEVLTCSGGTRAERLQRGIDASAASVVLLHHPRSLISQQGLEWLRDNADNEDKVRWGGFTHKFDVDHWALRFTSWYSNTIRGTRNGVIYLDHCIFFRKKFLTRPIPPVAIFEDTQCSYILREAAGLPTILPELSTTSAVRFMTNGILKQAYLNQKLKLQFFFGSCDRHMNLAYEKGLGLNDTPVPTSNAASRVIERVLSRPSMVLTLAAVVTTVCAMLLAIQ